MNNRIWNVRNPNQGDFKKVLCICSAGLLRSPTAAFVLQNEPFSFNTRAAGIDEDHALVPVDEVLVEWANEYVCMDRRHYKKLSQSFDVSGKFVYILNIPDIYQYREQSLLKLIYERYDALLRKDKMFSALYGNGDNPYVYEFVSMV